MKTMTKEQLHQWIEHGPEKEEEEPKAIYSRKDREYFEGIIRNLVHDLYSLKDSPLINDKRVAFYFCKMVNALIALKVLGSQALEEKGKERATNEASSRMD